MTISIQVNGKLRATLDIDKTTAKEQVLQAAKDHPNVKKYLEPGPIKKEIYVPGRIVNFVV